MQKQKQRWVTAQRRHGLGHQLHAEKQQAKTCGGLSPLAYPRRFSKKFHNQADGENQQRIVVQSEGNKLGREGGVPISAPSMTPMDWCR